MQWARPSSKSSKPSFHKASKSRWSTGAFCISCSNSSRGRRTRNSRSGTPAVNNQAQTQTARHNVTTGMPCQIGHSIKTNAEAAITAEHIQTTTTSPRNQWQPRRRRRAKRTVETDTTGLRLPSACAPLGDLDDHVFLPRGCRAVHWCACALLCVANMCCVASCTHARALLRVPEQATTWCRPVVWPVRSTPRHPGDERYFKPIPTRAICCHLVPQRLVACVGEVRLHKLVPPSLAEVATTASEPHPAAVAVSMVQCTHAVPPPCQCVAPLPDARDPPPRLHLAESSDMACPTPPCCGYRGILCWRCCIGPKLSSPTAGAARVVGVVLTNPRQPSAQAVPSNAERPRLTTYWRNPSSRGPRAFGPSGLVPATTLALRGRRPMPHGPLPCTPFRVPHPIGRRPQHTQALPHGKPRHPSKVRARLRRPQLRRVMARGAGCGHTCTCRDEARAQQHRLWPSLGFRTSRRFPPLTVPEATCHLSNKRGPDECRGCLRHTISRLLHCREYHFHASTT